ncbi:MAG: ribosome maturation factor RimP [Desulfarculaceae bacterium]|jgi:ribosome maturation factor RimP
MATAVDEVVDLHRSSETHTSGQDAKPKGPDPETGQHLRLLELIEPVVRSEGLVLVELVWRREGKGQVLRLYVDRPDGGITLDECAEVSRQVSDLLDVEDFIEQRYNLEVSSPGLTRRLKGRREYEIFAGRTAKLIVSDTQGATETLKGRLRGLAGDDVLLELNGRIRALPLARVVKANLDLED